MKAAPIPPRPNTTEIREGGGGCGCGALLGAVALWLSALGVLAGMLWAFQTFRPQPGSDERRLFLYFLVVATFVTFFVAEVAIQRAGRAAGEMGERVVEILENGSGRGRQ